jgi:hypothetical protein
MCDSLGKKNFSKVGLAAMIIENELKQEARSKNFAMSTALSFAILTQAKEQAKTSPLLQLKRVELEAMAAEVKGPYQNWGTFADFASDKF